MGLTTIGIFHTIIGIISLGAAILSYVKWGKIHLSKLSGKVYFYGTLITSLSALGISKHGGFNAGHYASLAIVVLLLLSFYIHKRLSNNKNLRYVENLILSFTFFFSWIPTITETFTRVPVAHPLAKDAKDPVIGNTILLFFVLFLIGSVYQFIQQRKINKSS